MTVLAVDEVPEFTLRSRRHRRHSLYPITAAVILLSSKGITSEYLFRGPLVRLAYSVQFTQFLPTSSPDLLTGWKRDRCKSLEDVS